MSASLLAIKLHIPPIRPDTLYRPRLFDVLDNAIHANMILIAAPAGFGKSTLVTGWLAQGSHHAAWLSLDERDCTSSNKLDRRVSKEQVKIVNPLKTALKTQNTSA